MCIMYAYGELLKNGGFEAEGDWQCFAPHCELVTNKHTGQHAMKISNRTHFFQGASQFIHVEPSKTYAVSGYIKLLNDQPEHHSQMVTMAVEFTYSSGYKSYDTAAAHAPVLKSDGWVHLQGEFGAPRDHVKTTRIYFQGPHPSVDFVVDDASVTEMTSVPLPTDPSWRKQTDSVIHSKRMSNIQIHVSAAPGLNRNDVQIRVVQKKKSFPFGTVVNAPVYNRESQSKYRDFIHNHFNWAVPEGRLKWPAVEGHQGHDNFGPALKMINGLKSHGIKVRGHTLVWSSQFAIQPWVQALSGDKLRQAVEHHIQLTTNITHGLVEHWDVNNENLHGTWYQDRLHDPDYNLELFRIAHRADPSVKLFLNDNTVVRSGGFTQAYLDMARKVKSANVGLYGMGVQSHFIAGRDPNPHLIKLRLDLLAQAGIPIWVTEMDLMAGDENTRADYYERALRALYGHPAVEGILLWGFWDQRHWRGVNASLVQGPDLTPNAAGRRVLDLLENQWMTDETHELSQSGDRFTVRGFHGDYELHVRYQGHERNDLKQTFSISPSQATHNVNVHIH
ncbi:hypothetical protein V1264_019202 [Littorina saxatilis]